MLDFLAETFPKLFTYKAEGKSEQLK